MSSHIRSSIPVSETQVLRDSGEPTDWSRSEARGSQSGGRLTPIFIPEANTADSRTLWESSQTVLNLESLSRNHLPPTRGPPQKV